VKVRAPATSANLGPGFDCAAVALDLWNELEITDGQGVVIEGEGEGELPADETNLAVRAYALVASPAGKRFQFVNRIPLERGLGSSAAAIALGLAAASGGDHSAAELLALGTQLESHQDNLGAALSGGACVTWNGRITKIAQTLPLQPIAVIPERRVVTTEARNALPPHISHEDGAFTAAHALLLGAGLAAGSAEWLALALEDRLHEPYRPSPLLDGIRADVPPGAVGATLSGSGPTVLVWARDRDACTAALAERYPDHRVLPLSVPDRGVL
jgi:homoserine kinase